MRIEKKEQFNVLYAEENKHIRAKNDIKDEEHEVNYFVMAYVPETVDETNMNDMYVEENIQDELLLEEKAMAYDILVGDSE